MQECQIGFGDGSSSVTEESRKKENRAWKKRMDFLTWLFYIPSYKRAVICQPLINMNHAGNFPVSNGGVRLGQYAILRILHNLIHRPSENVG
jgi:hypothetical protein